jgi:uncharacterized protein
MKAILNPQDVLTRYMEEDLPEFCGLDLLDVNQVGNFGNRPLHVACTRGDVAEVSALLSGGADIDSIGELGNTPLHEAVGQHHLDVVFLLLQRGASSKQENDFGKTALEVALLNADEKIIELFGHERTDNQ